MRNLPRPGMHFADLLEACYEYPIELPEVHERRASGRCPWGELCILRQHCTPAEARLMLVLERWT
jgi:hypothetical protein